MTDHQFQLLLRHLQLIIAILGVDGRRTARLDVSLTISLNVEPFGLVRQVCIGKGFAELD
jgi:hypothetical protein